MPTFGKEERLSSQRHISVLQKEIILSVAKQKNKSVIIMFFYSGKKIVTYKELESKIGIILQHIADNL